MKSQTKKQGRPKSKNPKKRLNVRATLEQKEYLIAIGDSEQKGLDILLGFAKENYDLIDKHLLEKTAL